MNCCTNDKPAYRDIATIRLKDRKIKVSVLSYKKNFNDFMYLGHMIFQVYLKCKIQLNKSPVI